MTKIFYDEMTWPEVNEAAKAGRVVLIPIGSIEDHGRHLPVMTDNLIITSMCNEAAQRIPEDVVVLSNVPYGFEAHHMDFPGSIDVNWDILIRLWVDIGRSLAMHGFKQIVFANGHGSNSPGIDLAAREVTIKTEAACASFTWPSIMREEMSALRESEFPGGVSHACEIETSLLLYLRPDLVDKRYLQKEIPTTTSKYIWRDWHRPSPVQFMDWWSATSESGTIGDPSLASAEKGKRVFEIATSKIAEFIHEFKDRPRKERVNRHFWG